MVGLSITILASLWQSNPTTSVPIPIQQVLAKARAYRTAQFDWTVTWLGGQDNGLVERFVTRIAEAAIWESRLGDEFGRHRRSWTDGEPDPVPLQTSSSEAQRSEREVEDLSGTESILVYEGAIWELPNVQRPLVGLIEPLDSARGTMPLDVQSIGLSPSWDGSLDVNPYRIPEPLYRGFESAVFDERQERGKTIITASWNQDSMLITWKMDPTKDGNPVWAGLEQDGRLVAHSETEYRRIDGRFVPECIRFYRGDPGTPFKRIDISRMTFDEPWHLSSITPSEIGSLSGTQFLMEDGAKMWTGADLVPAVEYWDLVNLFEVLPDEPIIEMTAEAQKQTVEQHLEFLRRRRDEERERYRRDYGDEPWVIKETSSERDDWDLYVEKFLASKKLPEVAVKQVIAIRDRAKKLRDASVRKNAAKLREAQAANDDEKIARLEGMVNRIFDRALVEQLDRLIRDHKGFPASHP